MQGLLGAPKARRGKQVFSPRPFRGSRARPAPWFQTSSLQSCARIHFSRQVTQFRALCYTALGSLIQIPNQKKEARGWVTGEEGTERSPQGFPLFSLSRGLLNGGTFSKCVHIWSRLNSWSWNFTFRKVSYSKISTNVQKYTSKCAYKLQHCSE